MLRVLKEHGWLKTRGKQRTASTRVLTKIRALNRLLCVGETLRYVLNCFSVVALSWIHEHSQPEWVDRYGHRLEETRLPTRSEGRRAEALLIGTDGTTLLNALYDPATPMWLQEIPEVDLLRLVWLQNFEWIEGTLRWRENENIPPSASFIGSPYDVEAHDAKKRSTTWVGYKVHLSETCEEDLPHLISHVETTIGPVSDDAKTVTIPAALAKQELLPSSHLVVTG